MQQRLKFSSGAAGTGIVAAESFNQLDIAVNDAVAALDVRLGREGLATLARDLKRSGGFLGPSDADVSSTFPPPVVRGSVPMTHSLNPIKATGGGTASFRLTITKESAEVDAYVNTGRG